jgi:ferrous iron transport protein B
LVLQVLEITDRAVVCLNLMDEARRHGLQVDDRRLARDLGVPVVPTAARSKEGLEELLAAIQQVASGEVVCKPHRVRKLSPDLERAVGNLSAQIESSFPDLPNARWVALRLLDGDERIAEAVRKGELGDLSKGAPDSADPDRTLSMEAAT